MIDIRKIIENILKKSPIVAIPIDAKPADLQGSMSNLKNTVIFPIIEKYTEVTTKDILYSFPTDNYNLDFDKLLPSVNVTPDNKVDAAISNVEPYDALITSGYIKVNEQLFMNYLENKFVAVVKKEGLQLDDGQIYSPSGAAVVCIKRISSYRDTANGWISWKNADGKTLNALFYELTKNK